MKPLYKILSLHLWKNWLKASVIYSLILQVKSFNILLETWPFTVYLKFPNLRVVSCRMKGHNSVNFHKFLDLKTFFMSLVVEHFDLRDISCFSVVKSLIGEFYFLQASFFIGLFFRQIRPILAGNEWMEKGCSQNIFLSLSSFYCKTFLWLRPFDYFLTLVKTYRKYLARASAKSFLCKLLLMKFIRGFSFIEQLTSQLSFFLLYFSRVMTIGRISLSQEGN